MNKQDCIAFSNENPICFLATTEASQPRVRALGFWFADETGFYFQTGAMKAIYHQLLQNPLTEVCFYKPEKFIGTMLRISGKVEFLNDPALKKKVIADRPFLRNFGLSEESPELIIFRIPHGEAHFWNMENNLNEKEIILF